MESEEKLSKATTVSAMFLVAGTCIGGGMIALPIAMGVSGFLPAMAVMGVCWLAMTITALLLVEVNLWMEEGAHIISMASRLLGPLGKIISWFVYLFICYASIVGYTAGGGVQIADFFSGILPWHISKELGCVIFMLLFGGVIDLGSRMVGRVNTVLFVSMITAYVALITIGIGEVKGSFLLNQRWSSSFMAIPLLLTSFSFHTMVPSLTPYLKRNVKALRWSVLVGTLIAFTVYALWLMLILGIVPVEGPAGLAEVLASGEPTTQFLSEHMKGKWVPAIVEYFAFFAIVTSFLGMTFGLFDFLADGLHLKKQGWGKWLIGALIVIPTLIFATQFERIFLYALDASGGFGDSILNGIIPVLMVWVGRYHMGFRGFRIPGGKPLLVVIGLFFACTLVLEVLVHLGHVTSIYDGYYDIMQVHNPERIEA